MNITFLGDVMLSRMVGRKYAEQPYKVISHELEKFITETSDVIIANLESPLAEGVKTEDHMQFNGNAKILKELHWVDVFSFSNNHINDCGSKGIDETLKVLQNSGFEYFGVSKKNNQDENLSFVWEDKEEKIVVISLTDMLNIPLTEDCPYDILRFDDDRVIELIKEEKQRGFFVFVYAHVGMMFTRYPNPITRNKLYAYIEAGADCVVTSHSHCLGGMEYYKGVPIFHSIGDFLMDGNSYVRRQACCLTFTMEDHKIVKWAVTPTVVDKELCVTLPPKKVEKKIKSSFDKVSRKLEEITDSDEYKVFYKKAYNREIMRNSLSTFSFLLRNKGMMDMVKMVYKRSDEVLRTFKWMTSDRSATQRDDDAISPDRKKHSCDDLF